ncbi:hypothetical protein [Catellatospora sp. NPDC049609]|uniref:hypothetical protein n=1 Tax=Catellatospora sp. NPDC049609 TaxID=3155505 RepID=UPI00341E893E
MSELEAHGSADQSGPDETDHRLERRYERLLALFPAGHRAEYGDEMLGVLLTAARPGQRFPGLRETADLVGCAVWMRLGGRGGGVADGRRAGAAAVYGLLAALAMVVFPLRDIGSELLWSWRMWGEQLAYSPGVWASLAAWSVAAAAAFTRFRAVAALAAWAGALYQVARMARAYFESPGYLVQSWWVAVFAVSAALALTARGSARGQSVLGTRRTAVVAVAAATLTVVPTAEMLLATIEPRPDGFGSSHAWGGISVDGMFGSYSVEGVISMVVDPLCVLALLACLSGMASGIRRRLAAMVMPTLAVAATVPPLFNGFLMSTVRFDPPVLLSAGEWLYLVGLPLVTFLLGALLVERAERHAYLIGLGRAAEREARLRQAEPSA